MLQDVTIDTIYLVTGITSREFNNNVKDMFNMKRQFNYNEYKTTHTMNNDTVPYAIKYNPIDQYHRPNINKIMRSNWNIKIELQHETLKNMPTNIKLLLQRYDWFINQVEIAYDFNTPISNHYSHISNGTKVKYKHETKDGNVIDYGQNYYIYANTSPQQALIYDKKKQLQQKYGNEITDNYRLRYEVTINPKLNEQIPIHHLQFDWIDKYLDKFSFIPNMKELSVPSKYISEMQKVMRRKAKSQRGIKFRNDIKQIVDIHGFDFVSTFHNNIDTLFDWIPRQNVNMEAN
ncbi:hypothetical protein [Litchfieldia salsa]|uniref:Uncharacterized protein n=1 Tax=Litchfieldia salsa TaxID=930152 RepID=A0A1H0UE32_9BACI|nr:hypothetical protein [Litchfieldia salsa]SDP64126.1 hypothetical protein SAMN05216565_104317 [Litchfieldia salsa]